MSITSVTLCVLSLVCFNANGIIAAKHQLENRIVNGDNANAGHFPHMVSLQEYSDRDHFCGGSIISDQHVITGAYCLQGLRGDPQNIYVVVGTNRRRGDGTAMNISKLFVHPGFDVETYKNDIALLQTVNRIEFTDKVRPITLPKADSTPEIDDVLLSGFGLIQEPNSARAIVKPVFLQWIQTTITSRVQQLDAKFAKWLHEQNILDDKKMCTINKFQTGACYGDNGSPLISKENNTLIGMLAFHVGCARGFPDIYTNIFSHLQWIEETMQIKELSD